MANNDSYFFVKLPNGKILKAAGNNNAAVRAHTTKSKTSFNLKTALQAGGFVGKGTFFSGIKYQGGNGSEVVIRFRLVDKRVVNDSNIDTSDINNKTVTLICDSIGGPARHEKSPPPPRGNQRLLQVGRRERCHGHRQADRRPGIRVLGRPPAVEDVVVGGGPRPAPRPLGSQRENAAAAAVCSRR